MTVFIPTNKATQTFLSKHTEYVAQPYWLRNIAEHSVVNGGWSCDRLKQMRSLDTGVYGPILWFSALGGSTYFNNAKVTSTLLASNGLLHELDAVVHPLGFYTTLKIEIGIGRDYSGFKPLIEIDTQTDDLLNHNTHLFTVFSPNVAAVTDEIKSMNTTLLLPVIRRHIVPDKVIFSPVMIGQSKPFRTLDNDTVIDVKVMDNKVFVGVNGFWSLVESGDVSTTNGVIHVINGVLGVTSGVNVYHALGLFNCSTCGTTLSKVSEVDALKKDLMDRTKMFTVFSPHNTAWKNLSGVDVSAMKKTLTRHLLSGKLTLAELKTKTEVMTLSGEKLTVKNESGKVFLEFDKMKAEVTSADKMASNGIIHVIDKVLIVDKPNPTPNPNPTPTPTPNPNSNRACLNSISLVVVIISPVFNLLCDKLSFVS